MFESWDSFSKALQASSSQLTSVQIMLSIILIESTKHIKVRKTPFVKAYLKYLLFYSFIKSYLETITRWSALTFMLENLISFQYTTVRLIHPSRSVWVARNVTSYSALIVLWIPAKQVGWISVPPVLLEHETLILVWIKKLVNIRTTVTTGGCYLIHYTTNIELAN